MKQIPLAAPDWSSVMMILLFGAACYYSYTDRIILAAFDLLMLVGWSHIRFLNNGISRQELEIVAYWAYQRGHLDRVNNPDAPREVVEMVKQGKKLHDGVP